MVGKIRACLPPLWLLDKVLALKNMISRKDDGMKPLILKHPYLVVTSPMSG